MITGEQIKTARKLLGWSQMTLALEASVAQSTVAKFERGESRPSVLSVSTIKCTLEGAGVEFLEFEPGVRLKKELGRSLKVTVNQPGAMAVASTMTMIKSHVVGSRWRKSSWFGRLRWRLLIASSSAYQREQ
jgi:transcriptional regulator with XRE-family HTH domain